MDWSPKREIAEPDVARFAEANGMDEAAAEEALRDALRGCPYHWSEIAHWLEADQKQSGTRLVMGNGEMPAAEPWICPFCAQPMRWIYWENQTPPQMRCGRGGWVEICDPCEWWGRFEMCWMS